MLLMYSHCQKSACCKLDVAITNLLTGIYTLVVQSVACRFVDTEWLRKILGLKGQTK